MTSLEDLLESEKRTVDPSQAELERLERRVGAALGIGLGAVATTTSLVTSAKGATALAKLGGALFANPIWLWGAGTLAGVGIGYAVALGAATDQPEANLSDSAQLIAEPAPRAPKPTEVAQQGEILAAPSEEPVAQSPSTQAPKRQETRVHASRSPSPADRLKQDARLLSDVSAALNRGAPEEALRLLDSTPLKGSRLGTEFRAARAIAWCQLGQHTRARSTVASLEKYAPDSPALLRVQQACKVE